MADTTQVMQAARDLGKLIASLEVTQKLAVVLKNLEDDVQTRRVLDDYNRHLVSLSQKEAEGKPIEVDDKQKLEQLQNAVIQNPLLRELQMAQMDHLDLMRRVDEAIAGDSPASGGPGVAASPLVNPDVTGSA